MSIRHKSAISATNVQGNIFNFRGLDQAFVGPDLLNFKHFPNLVPREGVIIECPLNGQYHDRRDVIITSRMAVSNNFITVTVI